MENNNILRKKEDEVIIVVPRNKLFENESLTFQGAVSIKDDNKLVVQIMDNIDMNYGLMRRGSVNETDVPLTENAELNFDYKQPIPYIVIKRGDQFFVTQRLQGGGEERLHGKLSMGAGGHMNDVDGIESFAELLHVNTMRELDEELSISGEYDIRIIGLINDDSEDVSRVHIGILGMLELDNNGEVTVKETEQLEGQWMTLEQLREKDTYDRLENWGKIVVDMM